MTPRFAEEWKSKIFQDIEAESWKSKIVKNQESSNSQDLEDQGLQMSNLFQMALDTIFNEKTP